MSEGGTTSLRPRLFSRLEWLSDPAQVGQQTQAGTCTRMLSGCPWQWLEYCRRGAKRCGNYYQSLRDRRVIPPSEGGWVVPSQHATLLYPPSLVCFLR